MTGPTEPIETDRKFCVTCGHRLVTIGEFDRIANYYTNTKYRANVNDNGESFNDDGQGFAL